MRPDGYLLTRRGTVVAMSGVMLAIALAALHQTIVTTALPHIVGELGGLDHYSWVFAAYMLASTVTTPLYGRLSDIYGRRPFFVAGIVLFMTGAVLSGIAGSMTDLIIGRVVQGLGAGAILPLSIAIVGDLVPPSDRGRWQGALGAVMGVATVLGPITGGWISDNADWRWVFFVSLPVGLTALAVVGATLRIPPHPDRDTRIDYTGAALLTLGLSSGLLTIVQGTAPAVGGVSLVALVVFVWWERRVEQPIVPVELFRERLFRATNLTAFMVGTGMYGVMMFVPLYVQDVLGASATTSGLVTTPLMVALMFTTIGSGLLITRTGRYRWALLLGPSLMCGSYALLTTLDVTSPSLHITIAMAVAGLGIGLLLQNISLVIQNGVPTRHLGAATSAVQFSRSIGGTIGVSVMGAIVARGQPAQATAQELATAIHPIFVLGLVLMALTILLVLLIPELPLRRTVRETPIEPSTQPIPSGMPV